jgi:VCBS repeat-containing protein
MSVSDQVNVGDYSLEISGGEVLVRDESGAIVETVDLDEVEGELTLPDGQIVDLASLFAEAALDPFQTAAGPANDNIINDGSNLLTPFHGAPQTFGDRDSAGTLNETSLALGLADGASKGGASDTDTLSAPASFDWSRHDLPDQAKPSDHSGNQQNVSGGEQSGSNTQSSDDGEDQDYGLISPPPANDDERDAAPAPPTAEQQPANDDEGNDPVTPPTDEQEPLPNDDEGDEALTPPTDEQEPPADDDEGDDPVTPPTDEQEPLPNDDEGDEALTPPTDEQPPPADDDQPTDEQQASEDPEPDSDPGTPPVDDPQPSTQVNAAPTDISLDATTVVENTAGAIVGTLTIVDPDAGDAHTLALSDDRFEVVGGQLKLKNGIWLDFESEPSVAVSVTATDSAGNQLSETFALSVSDVNEAQTALSLDGHQVSENAPGAVVGTLTVADPDAGDNQSFAVSDSRFEVMNGELKLKDGVSLDYETEQSVSVTVTATDNGGHSVQNAFTISVVDVDEAPPVVTDPSQAVWTSQLGNGQTTLGSGDDGLYIDSKSFNPVRMGDGYDTVHVARNGSDFGHTQAVKLSNAEAIDTTGYGVNKVSLSINDVLDMTDSDNRLTIIGDKGDSVTLTSSGGNYWTIVSSSAEFTTYAYSDPATQAVVEISNQLNAQVS